MVEYFIARYDSNTDLYTFEPESYDKVESAVKTAHELASKYAADMNYHLDKRNNMHKADYYIQKLGMVQLLNISNGSEYVRNYFISNSRDAFP